MTGWVVATLLVVGLGGGGFAVGYSTGDARFGAGFIGAGLVGLLATWYLAGHWAVHTAHMHGHSLNAALDSVFTTLGLVFIHVLMLVALGVASAIFGLFGLGQLIGSAARRARHQGASER